MIDRILIRDFQNQQKLVLPLDRITTVCGPTDAGKSSVLQALLWACRNQPSGVDFIRHGAKRASVQLHVGKHRITRDRGQRNHYFLDGVKFAAFKASVPDAIAKVLNVAGINFQEQDDPRFWLSLSPGELSKELNKLIQLDVSDRAITYLANELRNARAQRAVVVERRNEAKATIERLGAVPAMAEEMQAVSALAERLETARSERAKLAQITHQGKTVALACRNAANALNRASKLAQTGSGLATVRAKLARLRSLVTEAGQSRCSTDAPSIDRLQRFRETADAFAERNRALRSLLDDATETRRVLWQIDHDLEVAQTLMHRLAPKQRIKCPKCRHVFSPSPAPTSTSHPRCQHAGPTGTGTKRKRSTSTSLTP